MNLLVLGGGQFVGRHIVEAALERGHTVSSFSRGKTNPQLFPQVRKLIGDRRAGDLGALEQGTWDAVVDVNGYFPRELRQSTSLLRGRVGRYLFISTVSVYADPNRTDEDGPVRQVENPETQEMTPEVYGGLKAICEDIVRQAYGEQATIVRPHLVVGPHDHTGRFSYWPWRAAQGGEMLFPAPPEDAMQLIDARDLAAFVVHLLEQDTPGTYNGARPHFTLAELRSALAQATGNAFEPVWVDAGFLQQQGVRPWVDLPAWIPGDGLSHTPTGRSQQAGLKYRSLLETVQDTLTWLKNLPEVRVVGISREREAELLEAWKARGMSMVDS
ncbi:NAD-dependent epimerase/dehydratase family protein [Calidithermus roseus]|uniref:UDP-glucose 4-epimerase n=1 Tax=Calidithermus roseus TaxID=1644118 RepID=A0A399EUE7_9DEIN|nr:NAD-dependent epimerase/dehydratase family protein [Calidithermus roseus]RIH88244.1 NAD dependent epimerase/dehydratase family protein [Calidithermus roseus]